MNAPRGGSLGHGRRPKLAGACRGHGGRGHDCGREAGQRAWHAHRMRLGQRLYTIIIRLYLSKLYAAFSTRISHQVHRADILETGNTLSGLISGVLPTQMIIVVLSNEHGQGIRQQQKQGLWCRRSAKIGVNDE